MCGGHCVAVAVVGADVLLHLGLTIGEVVVVANSFGGVTAQTVILGLLTIFFIIQVSCPSLGLEMFHSVSRFWPSFTTVNLSAKSHSATSCVNVVDTFSNFFVLLSVDW